MNAAELKRNLKSIGWTQVRLANAVGVHPNSVSKMIAADKVSKPVAAYLELKMKLKGIAE